MQVIKYLKLPFCLDVELLQKDTQVITSAYWQPHYQVNHYDGQWSAIPLRSVNGKIDNIMISPHEEDQYCDTIFLNKSQYFKTVLELFQCELKSVRLLKLDSGSSIKEHKDFDLNYEKGEIRIHIPVVTHSDVEFILDKERLILQEGECWYMNFNLLHSIVNKSKIDRIHLVIDAVVNDWVKEIFNSDLIVTKKIIKDESKMLSESSKNQMIQLLREMNTDVSNRMANELEAAVK